MSPAAAPTRLLCTALLTLTLTACSGNGGGSDAPARSKERFCAELDAGNERMRANYEAAGEGAGDQIGMIVANIGEFTRLVHKLDDAAPGEISTEMSDAREAWDASAESAPEAVSDPLKAIAAGLLTSITSSASTRAVDGYAAEHCGSTVFGTVPAGETATGGTDPLACPDTGPGGTFTPTDPELTYTDLEAGIETMTASTDTDIAAAATNLRSALAVLDPAPEWSTEALGRLEWDSPGSGRDLYAALNDAVTAACMSGLGDPDALTAWFDDLAPAATATGHLTGSAYGRCAHSLGWVTGHELLWCEETGQVIVVDYDTGTTETIDPPGMTPAEDPDDPDAPDPAGGYPEPWPTTDGFAWTSVTTEAASGLELETWEVTLHVVDLDGTEQLTTVVDSGNGEESSAYNLGPGYAVDDLLVLPVPHGTKAVDTTGQQRWFRKDLWGDVWPITPHVVSVDGLDALDVRTGKRLTGATGLSDFHDECARNLLLDDAIIQESADGKLTVTPRPDGLNRVTTMVGSTLLGYDDSDRLTGYSLTGRVLWRLPAGVEQGYDIYDDWLVITNPSGEPVLADSSTGKDITADRPEILDAATLEDGTFGFAGTAISGEGRLVTEDAHDGLSVPVHDVPPALCGDLP